MKHITRIILGVLIVLLGIYTLIQTFGVQYFGIFQELDFIPFVLIISLTVIVFFMERINYLKKRKVFEYVFTLAGLVFIILISLKKYQYKLIDESKNLLVVSNFPLARNVLTYEFKENGKFKLTEMDLLGHSVFYGNYIQNNNKIEILNIYKHKPPLPLSGIIVDERMYWRNFDTMIIGK